MGCSVGSAAKADAVEPWLEGSAAPALGPKIVPQSAPLHGEGELCRSRESVCQESSRSGSARQAAADLDGRGSGGEQRPRERAAAERRGSDTLTVTARRAYDAAMLKRFGSARGGDGEPLLSISSSTSRSAKGDADVSGWRKEAMMMAGGAASRRSDAMGSSVSTGSREEAIARGTELLRNRLECLRMNMVSIEDDGNCQFRAISQELFGSQSKHYQVRCVAASHMKNSPGEFSILFESKDEWDDYLCSMASRGTWGDELTLRAIADAFRVKIHVVTSEEENWYLQYSPKEQLPVRELFLMYMSPIHYNTLAPSFAC